MNSKWIDIFKKRCIDEEEWDFWIGVFNDLEGVCSQEKALDSILVIEDNSDWLFDSVKDGRFKFDSTSSHIVNLTLNGLDDLEDFAKKTKAMA